MRFVQLHLDGGGVRAGVGRVQRGEVRNHANIRHDHLEVLRFDFVPNQIFDFGHVLVGYFNARPGGNFEVDAELAGIGLGKERQARAKDKSPG